MEESKDTEKVCKYCGKKFRSGNALGGHIRIHTTKKKKKKIFPQQRYCSKCGKWFVSLKSHNCHSNTPSDTEMKQSDSDSDSESESFSNGKSSEIDQEATNAALALMKMSMDSTFNQLESGDDNLVILSDSDSSDSDYYINGPKKPKSDISLKSIAPKFNKSKRKRAFPSYDRNAPIVTKDHECPICFRVFKSVKALYGHKRSHSIKGQGHRNQQQTSQMPNPWDLNLPSSDSDE